MANATNAGLEGLQDITSRAKNSIRDIKGIKSSLKPRLDPTEVNFKPESYPALATAIREVFGDIEIDEYGVSKITFDMYITCLNVIRQAGKAKASSIIDKSSVFK